MWPIIEAARDVSIDTSSDVCFSLAQMWTKDCIEHHPMCRVPTLTPLPTRVIAVGDELTEPRLYVTHQESAKYVALSYRWVSPEFITAEMKTTESTLEQRKGRIAYSQLSKTFQDAITIARRLQLQYLWIDSLCIIQDSKADWESEAGRMRMVYEHAFVTIVGEGMQDSASGCFVTSPPECRAFKVPRQDTERLPCNQPPKNGR
jgi:hypothetical protein